MKTDLYNKHHLIFILLLLYQTSPNGSIIYTVFPFIFLHILPIHSLNLPPRLSRQVPLYFPDPTACLRAQGLKQRSLTPFYLPPFKRWVAGTAKQKGHLQKIKKILSSFQKLQPAVIYIVEGREKARGFDKKHSIYFQDGHRKCRNGMPEFKKGTAFLPSTFSGKVTNSANTEKHRETQDSRNPLQGRNDGRLMPGARRRTSYSSGRRPCRHRIHWA